MDPKKHTQGLMALVAKAKPAPEDAEDRPPTDDPAEAMTLYEHVEGDAFRRVRDDDRSAETLTSTRDADGRAVSARTFDYVLSRVRPAR